MLESVIRKKVRYTGVSRLLFYALFSSKSMIKVVLLVGVCFLVLSGCRAMARCRLLPLSAGRVL